MVNNEALVFDERRWALGKLEIRFADPRLPARLAALKALGELVSSSRFPTALASRDRVRGYLDAAMPVPVAEVQRAVAIGYGMMVANGELPGEERQPVLEIIARLADDDAHPDQRILGVLALTRLASSGAAPYSERELAQQYLARLARDPDPAVRSAVAAALVTVGPTVVRDADLDANRGDHESRRRGLTSQRYPRGCQ